MASDVGRVRPENANLRESIRIYLYLDLRGFAFAFFPLVQARLLISYEFGIHTARYRRVFGAFDDGAGVGKNGYVVVVKKELE